MASLARLAATSAATLLFLSLAGCIDYDEVLELASDGSGHLTVDLTVDMTFYVE